MQDDDDALPIFDVQLVELQFDISAEFVAAQVADNVLILALSSGRILRFDLDNSSDIDDIDLPKRPAEVGIIRKVFLDPSASHLIISTTLGDNFYLHTQSRQPKALSRLKGYQIDCVAWNPSLPTASTREILLGCSDGNIYETYIESSTEFYRREEKYVRPVYHSTDGPITGLWADAASGRSDIRRVLVATPSRILHFISKGGRSTSDSSNFYQKLFENETPQMRDSPGGQVVGPSEMRFSPNGPEGTASTSNDRAFGWLTSQQVVTGVLADPGQSDVARKTISEAKAIPKARFSARREERRSSTTQEGIKAVLLTRFHVLGLLGDRLVAVNRLDESVVYDQRVLQPGQNFLGLYADQQKNTFWLLTQRQIFEIVVTDEGRHVWKIMLHEQKFDLAQRYALTVEQKDAVAIASGDHLISRENYSEAAAMYGKSSKPFEDVALTFIDKGENDALRKYLTIKLSQMKKSLTMQRIMVTSWLVELYMVKLNALDDAISATADPTTTGNSRPDSDDLPLIRREFQDFVGKYKSDLDQRTVYEIIGAHGREEELLHFASAIDDFEYVLSYWIQRERWQDAMTVLKRQAKPDIFYQYSSVLMEHAPADFTEVLMRQTDLDETKLIPALLNYSRTAEVSLSQNQAVRYLLYCINTQGSKDASVHNTLISIYASHPTSDESALLVYLQSQSAAHEQNYDADFALRLSINNKRVRSAVHIYCTMSQFAAAIDLALKYDEIDIAADVADRPENDQILRKKLWLKVAKKVMSTSRGISSAMEFLKRCDFLRIEDLIPLFPDFIVIDDFKEEICEALEDYSRQIDNLRLEMDKSADTAHNIKGDIKALDQRYAIVEPGERCWLCRLPLLMRQFFVFPCQHSFHADCLGKAVVNIGPAGKGRRIKDLQSEIVRGVVSGNKKEKLVTELDGLVAGACILCGDMAVKQVDQPFVMAADDREEWAI
ncbi:Vacuolar protein sorting-associated protein 18 [Sphaceloma murrayae]|uniref:Vacuolar protein sorting-associated protein 18 n=1 Tax=Sphaceloma murrayae TaxID=2082308 RepID=A0A2K1QJN3_9PEZI|nr:Vacuolar protein sorting-associated protein 18 [Sphaceloma murrayae]